MTWINNGKQLSLKVINSKWDDFREKAVARGCSVKQVSLEISQNSQESTCVRVSFLILLQSSGQRCSDGCNHIKKETLTQFFPGNFAKFLRTPPGDFFCIAHSVQLCLRKGSFKINLHFYLICMF